MNISKNKNIIALLSYFLLVFYIVFLTPNRLSHVNNNKLGKYNLNPLVTKKYSLTHNNTVWDFINSSYGDLIGNVAMFIPFPILLLNTNRKINLLLALIIPVFISVSIELIQFALNLGYADVDDVIMNSAGALLGMIGFIITVKIYSKDKQRSS